MQLSQLAISNKPQNFKLPVLLVNDNYLLFSNREKEEFAGDISICRWFALNLRLSCLLVVLVPNPFGYGPRRARQRYRHHAVSNLAIVFLELTHLNQKSCSE